MTFPSDEQRIVLEAEDRIIIVRAAPGSGKTRVFIEFLKQRMDRLARSTQGVAALSFTNSARQEISDRLGAHVGAPHFVGTLDSFLLKYIVKPFGHVVGLNTKGPRLLADPLDKAMKGFEVKYGPDNGHRATQFMIRFVGGSVTEPELEVPYGYNTYRITAAFRDQVLRAKHQQWASHGFVTHSDSHYLAAKILSHPDFGAALAKIVTSRFPLILVDEFQDTGWFLSKALIELLRSSNSSGLVVGDPDQAIYEFSGARPVLFDELEALDGAEKYDLTCSRRCPVLVCRAAAQLSDLGKSVEPRVGAPRGRLKLLGHNQTAAALDERMLATIEELSAGSNSIAVLARRTKVADDLEGKVGDAMFLGQSKAGKQLAEAVQRFCSSDAAMAVKLVNVVAGELLLGREDVDSEVLADAGIDSAAWRGQISILLRELTPVRATESWNGWLGRAKNQFEGMALQLNVSLRKPIGPKLRTHADGNAARALTTTRPNQHRVFKDAVFQNIHQAKGTEYDTVFLYYPRLTAAQCISADWFIADSSSEERRIGFVGVSRSKANLILCVHRETYFALKRIRPEFTQLFELDETLEGPAQQPRA